MQLNSLKKQQACADGINWLTASVMILFHIGAIAALFFFTWKAFFLALFCGGFPAAWESAWAITAC